MQSVVCGVAVLSSLAGTVNAAVAADKVTSLPGYGAPPTNHFSGLIPTGVSTNSSGKLHYWLVTAEKADAPITLWLNGGPGSSSLIGLLTENGPVHTNQHSLNNLTAGVPELFYNPYTWNKYSHVLYLEMPKGVGFSFCDDPKNCVNTDESTATDAHEFLVNFFALYPEYKTSDFYITGESYAGTYIPMLMQEIDTKGVITNLKGAAIGNGCWGGKCFYGTNQMELNFHVYSDHYLVSESTANSVRTLCDFSAPDIECLAAFAKLEQEAGSFDVYNIYDTCGKDGRPELDDSKGSKLAQQRAAIEEGVVVVSTEEDSYTPHPQLTGGLNDYICGASTAQNVWLAQPAVMEALHVKKGTGGMTYHSTAGDLRPVYAELFRKYRMIIYSGDVDACVPYWGTQMWLSGMGNVTKEWHPWKSTTDDGLGQVVAGYATSYDTFELVTVKGSGHMVPQFQQAFADTLFKNFITNTPF